MTTSKVSFLKLFGSVDGRQHIHIHNLTSQFLERHLECGHWHPKHKKDNEHNIHCLSILILMIQLIVIPDLHSLWPL